MLICEAAQLTVAVQSGILEDKLLELVPLVGGERVGRLAVEERRGRLVAIVGQRALVNRSSRSARRIGYGLVSR